jgi:NAD(P)H-nitrite reductase large subunit
MVLEQVHALGIPVILDRAKEILGKDTVTGLRTYSGEVLECNIIVLATGVQPMVELAVRAGLRVGRGIKVNDRMQTSDPAIYAVGECAEHRGRVYGLVGPGYEQATVAAQNIVGNQATYEGSVVVTLLKGIDLPAVTISRMEVDLPSPKEVIYKQAKDKVYRKLMLHRGRLIGIQAIGDWPELWRVQAAVRRKQWLGPWQRQRFRTTGSLWPERSLPPVSEWPAQATVCNCKGITRGNLSEAVQAGSGTVKALQEQTGAGLPVAVPANPCSPSWWAERLL